MSAEVDRAFEADGFLVNALESNGGRKAGFFSGDADPWIQVPDAPLGSVYAKTDGTVWILNVAGGGTPANWGQSSNAVVWRNLWAAGTYQKNEMVRDGDWTMIANTETTDRAAPVTEGEPAFALPDAPSWATASQSTPRITGARFTVTDEILLIEAIRIWTENTDADTEYFFQLVDVTDTANEKILADGPIDNTSQGWVEVDIGSLLVGNGQTLDLRSFQLKQTPASEFTHTWDAVIPDDVGVDPGSGNWSRDSLFTVVRISDTDNTVTDRSADLATLGIGDKLEINETGSTRRVEHYTINSATDQGTYWEYGVDLDYVDQTIRNGRGCDIHGINTGAPAAIDIPSLANEWLNVPDVDGFNVTSVASIGASLDDNAYGVDLKFAEFVVSPDWDLVAYSGSLQFSGGAGGAATFLELTDTPSSYAGQGGNFLAVNTAEDAIEFVPPDDMSAVQASRTTDFSVTGTATNITLDQTDVENDATVIEHNNTNTERIDVKEAGLYAVLFHMTGVAASGVSEASAEIVADIHVNDGVTAIPGSVDIVKTFFDSSIINDDLEVNLVGQVLYEAAANDYFTVQAHSQAVSGTISLVTRNVSLKVVRLKGPRGPKGADGADGAPGAGSTVNIADEGTNIANTPHSRLDFVGAGVTASDGGGGTATITIPGGGAGLANDAVQARRTTGLTLTGGGTFDDVPHDATDVETDAAVIEHNNTNTDNVDVKATGTYEINYHAPIDTTGLSNGDTWDINGRIRVNDTGGAVLGSTSFVTAWQDGSVDGSDFGFFLDKTVIVNLTAADFVTLQIAATDNSGSGGTIALAGNATITVKRLK